MKSANILTVLTATVLSTGGLTAQTPGAHLGDLTWPEAAQRLSEAPLVIIPIVPGKNITVISEVIALDYLLKAYGYHPAERLNIHLMEMMKRRSQARAWVREDTE